MGSSARQNWDLKGRFGLPPDIADVGLAIRGSEGVQLAVAVQVDAAGGPRALSAPSPGWKKEKRVGGGTACLRCDTLQRWRPDPNYVRACGPADRGRRRQRYHRCEGIVHPSRMHGVIPRFGRAAYGGTTRTPCQGAGAPLPGLLAGLMQLIDVIQSSRRCLRCRACVVTTRSAFCDGVRQHGCDGPNGRPHCLHGF